MLLGRKKAEMLMREIQILNGYRGATILLVAVPEEIPLVLRYILNRAILKDRKYQLKMCGKRFQVPLSYIAKAKPKPQLIA